MEAVETAVGKLKSMSFWKKATPQIISPTVVGTNKSPAIAPHRYDCGFPNTIR